ncbi:MAG: hypothetical protein A3F91_13150 [Flavobacteria bacterium RIFCSPLOWO2_12_FULL_35_11]|nr:MAG: hypothetical protein A3F91_13150 [Flavobacteria bacterium RIFCSPLOWO2_12_FULL_35_11]
MKTLITLVSLVSLFFAKNQENLTIKATYDGYEEGFYYFTDENDYSFFFEGVEATASEKYDLTDKRFIGKTFDITYKVETTKGEYGEEYYASIIVDLVMEE